SNSNESFDLYSFLSDQRTSPYYTNSPCVQHEIYSCSDCAYNLGDFVYRALGLIPPPALRLSYATNPIGTIWSAKWQVIGGKAYPIRVLGLDPAAFLLVVISHEDQCQPLIGNANLILPEQAHQQEYLQQFPEGHSLQPLLEAKLGRVLVRVKGPLPDFQENPNWWVVPDETHAGLGQLIGTWPSEPAQRSRVLGKVTGIHIDKYHEKMVAGELNPDLWCFVVIDVIPNLFNGRHAPESAPNQRITLDTLKIMMQQTEIQRSRKISYDPVDHGKIMAALTQQEKQLDRQRSGLIEYTRMAMLTKQEDPQSHAFGLIFGLVTNTDRDNKSQRILMQGYYDAALIYHVVTSKMPWSRLLSKADETSLVHLPIAIAGITLVRIWGCSILEQLQVDRSDDVWWVVPSRSQPGYGDLEKGYPGRRNVGMLDDYQLDDNKLQLIPEAIRASDRYFWVT
ncbi:MAG: hypothetical protein OJI67_05555, partial [Prosthecobacter sp.]|nr:hypothetical protein [Prosthecobacter sp.]